MSLKTYIFHQPTGMYMELDTRLSYDFQNQIDLGWRSIELASGNLSFQRKTTDWIQDATIKLQSIQSQINGLILFFRNYGLGDLYQMSYVYPNDPVFSFWVRDSKFNITHVTPTQVAITIPIRIMNNGSYPFLP